MTPPPAAVRPMRPDEVATVADLHRRSFPGYASTKLGPGYCRRLLAAYRDRSDSWVDVAVGDQDQIAGYLVGAPPATQQAIDRSLLPWAALNAYRQPAELLANGRRAVRRISSRVRPSTPDRTHAAPATDAVPATEPATVRVVLVAVDPAARGRGAGDALLAAFARRAAERGHRVADLSVAADNDAAHRAYRRNGWVADEAGEHFRLDLSPPTAP